MFAMLANEYESSEVPGDPSRAKLGDNMTVVMCFGYGLSTYASTINEEGSKRRR